MPHLLVTRPNHQNFLRRLHKVYWARAPHHVKVGDACWRAGLVRQIGGFAVQHLVIVLFYDVLCPLPEIRIGQIGNAVTGLAVFGIVDVMIDSFVVAAAAVKGLEWDNRRLVPLSTSVNPTPNSGGSNQRTKL